MRTIALLLALALLPLHAADPTPGEPSHAASTLSPALVERLRTEPPPQRPLAPPTRLWKASLAALAIATAADLATSLGKRELNPALRSADGRFGARGVAIKSLVTGSSLAGQWFLVRRSPQAAPYAAVANFGMAGVFSAAALHNSRNRAVSASPATLAK
ncbi:MAG: hypothetical protein IPJ98_12890 [Bryobacterales bacterium]|nr:hypothetical protein [Bryobacterales bacterium]